MVNYCSADCAGDVTNAFPAAKTKADDPICGNLSMRKVAVPGFVMIGLLAIAIVGAAHGQPAVMVDPDASVYDSRGRLVPPPGYREWVFLSSGFDMSYSERAVESGTHIFDNVFAPPAAYAAFKRTGTWPDKTVLILENRSGVSKGSINVAGHFQTGVVGLEAHVKDTTRFKGGWGFFAFEGGESAELIPYSANCYACHQMHAAVDRTFVQFYPTLLPIATARGTLTPAYAKAAASKP
jgi:Cytochrome P460